MIRYRQKEFIAWLMPTIMAGGTAVSVGSAIKSHNDNKKTQEELDKQNALIKAQNDRLQKLNEEVKRQKEFGIGGLTFGVDLATMGVESMNNSSAESQRESSLDNQKHLFKEQERLVNRLKKKNLAIGQAAETIKSYSVGSILKEVGKVGKSAFGEGIKSNVIMGVGAAGVGYGINKYISHDMKKNNLEINSETGQVQQRAYNTPPTPPAAPAQQAVKKSGVKGLIKGSVGNVLMGGAFEAAPALSYMAEKKQAMDMARMTQRSYAIPSLAAIKSWGSKTLQSIKSPKAWWQSQPLYKDWKSTTTGFINNISSMGIGGKKNVQKFAQGLSNSTNSTLKGVGDWMIKNPNAANLATAVPLAGAGYLTFEGVQKATEKGIKSVDSNAYAYRDAKDKIVPQ